MAPPKSYADVLSGPKSPTWCCSCGEASNWASRIRCRGCGKGASQSTADKARAAAKQQPAPSRWKPPSGAWTHGPPPAPAALGKQAARIKQLEGEVRKLRQGATDAAGDASGASDTKEGTDEEVDALRRDIKSLEGMSEGESLLASKKQKLQALQAARQASKPLHHQLRDIQGKIDRKERALARKVNNDLPRLRKAVETAQASVDQAVLDVQEAETELEKLRSQKEKLVAAEGKTEQRTGHSTVDLNEADFSAALGRLATVVTALPRAYNAGNLEMAYEGIMENLRALASLAPVDEAVTAAADSPVADSDDEFPEEYLPNSSLRTDGR